LVLIKIVIMIKLEYPCDTGNRGRH
jgi:hypothetical protein